MRNTCSNLPGRLVFIKAKNTGKQEDRILTTQGKEQIYGSQLKWNEAANKYEFFPIMDAANVNKRRAEAGLGPIEEYAKFFGTDYVVPKTNIK